MKMARRKSTENLRIILDDTPIAADRLGRTMILSQASLIQSFNYHGRIFASMADIYNAAKANHSHAVAELKMDMESAAIITSTRVDYRKTNLEAKIMHYCDSKIVVPVERKVFVPMYFTEELDDVLSKECGVNYLRVMFNTQDSPEEMKRNLLKLSYKDSVWVITSDRRFAQKDNKRAVAISHRYNRLVINATLDIKSEYGRSMGAMIIP